VLIKGGHHEGEDGSEGGKVVQDYLLIRDKGIWFTGPRYGGYQRACVYI
jgi:hypothetical protein